MKKEKKEDEVKKSRRRTSLKCLIIISSSVLLPALIIGSFMYNVDHIQRLEPIKYNDILKNEPSHKWLYLNKFLSKETSRMFTKLAQNEDPFSTINDLNVESAGESVPVGHVACRHPFMTLNLVVFNFGTWYNILELEKLICIFVLFKESNNVPLLKQTRFVMF